MKDSIISNSDGDYKCLIYAHSEYNARGVGFAVKRFVNPFPGQSAHWDILASNNYYSGWFVPPFSSEDGPLSDDPSGLDQLGPFNSGDPTGSVIPQPRLKKK